MCSRARLKRRGQLRLDIILEVDGDDRHVLEAAAVGDAAVVCRQQDSEFLAAATQDTAVLSENEFPPKADGKCQMAHREFCLRYGLQRFG